MAPVPSLTHSSRPLLPSLAVNTACPFTETQAETSELALPGAMSFSCAVPPKVPSVTQISRPLVPSDSVNIALLLSATPLACKEPRKTGAALAAPALISRNSTVPPAVPVLTHNSVPLLPSLAVKTVRGPTLTPLDANEPPPPALMSLKSTVPATVPSVIHTSSPLLPSLALNSARDGSATPFTARYPRTSGAEPPAPGRTSFSWNVLAGVP